MLTSTIMHIYDAMRPRSLSLHPWPRVDMAVLRKGPKLAQTICRQCQPETENLATYTVAVAVLACAVVARVVAAVLPRG